MSVFTWAHIPLKSLVKTYFGNLVYTGMTAVLFLYFGGSISVSALAFLGSGLILCCEITLAKNGKLVHLETHLSLLNFKFACLHMQGTLFNVSSWSLPFSLKPAK